MARRGEAVNGCRKVTFAECKAWALEHPMQEYHVYESANNHVLATRARFNPDIIIGTEFSDSPHCFEFYDEKMNEWSWDDSPFYPFDTYFIPRKPVLEWSDYDGHFILSISAPWTDDSEFYSVRESIDPKGYWVNDLV